MMDIPFDPLSPEVDGMETGAGNFSDIWDDSSTDDVLLPPLDVDVMDVTCREIGDPEELSEYWHFQGDTQDCALYAQGGILEAEGQPFDIVIFEQQGQEGGWFDPEYGTYVNHFGDLLDENGVPVTRYEGASIYDLAYELEQGHGVVVAVDTLPIWGEEAGHALWVTGIEVGPDGKPTSVICNDSGREDGRRIAYPYENFMQAWNMYGNIAVATKNQLSGL
jgi:hypothetical protein